jgi:tetratricopeptide (TPR) repeat protein
MAPVLLALASTTLMLLNPEQAVPEPDADIEEAAPEQDADITVTGERIERNLHGEAEAPYSEVERTPLGSRIARRVRERPFRAAPTNSGLAALVGNSGSANTDATGGFNAVTRYRRITECVPEHEEVSEEIACLVFRVNHWTGTGEFEEASNALRPVLARRGLTGRERQYLGQAAYRLGGAADDPVLREAGLHMLLASGYMSEADRVGALRALAALAFERGDEMKAVDLLETLSTEVPSDARVLAGLAGLYERLGRRQEARGRMTEALAILRQRGETPPPEWTALVDDRSE